MEENILELGNIIYNQKDISPSDLGVSSRQINYWIDKNLIPFVEREQKNDNDQGKKVKRIRLNLSQAIWTSIIKELLELGVPVKILEKLAHSVWQKPREEKYADRILEYHIKKNPLKLSDELLKRIRIILKDNLLMEYYVRTIINPFTEMVKGIILSSNNQGYPYSMIYVPKTNECEFFYGSKNLMFDLQSIYLQETTINIPLLPIFSRVIGVDISNKKKTISYLTEKEQEIRDIVVFKKPKIVEIAYEGTEIKPIIVREQHRKAEELAKLILENRIKLGSKLVAEVRPQGNYKITLISK